MWDHKEAMIYYEALSSEQLHKIARKNFLQVYFPLQYDIYNKKEFPY